MFNLFKHKDPEVLEKLREAWEKKRQRGKLRFVLMTGVLGWGGFMFIFTNCVYVFVNHQKLDWPLVIIGLIAWPPGR